MTETTTRIDHIIHGGCSSPQKHKWKESDWVVLTNPAGYHRTCSICGDVEITNDHKTWRRCFESPYAKRDDG